MGQFSTATTPSTWINFRPLLTFAETRKAKPLHPAIQFQDSRFRPKSILLSKISPELQTQLSHSPDFKKIGRTPVKEIKKNIFLKSEAYNPTGSIKDRTAAWVLLKKIEQKAIKDQDTLVIATSGSYGISVHYLINLIKNNLNLTLYLIVVTPEIYRRRQAFQQLEALGLHGTVEDSHSGNQNVKQPYHQIIYTKSEHFADAMHYAKSLASQHNAMVYLDQHYDETHAQAHLITAEEIYLQVPEVTDVVLTTGSGATATGVHAFFQNKNVRIHARPAKPKEIPGLSDSSTYNNYFKPENFVGYQKNSFFNLEKSQHKKQEMLSHHGMSVGLSTGAALSLADEVKENNPDAVIVVISPSKDFI